MHNGNYHTCIYYPFPSLAPLPAEESAVVRKASTDSSQLEWAQITSLLGNANEWTNANDRHLEKKLALKLSSKETKFSMTQY